MSTVYLAGPIDKVSTEKATTWREHAARRLNELGHLVCDPNRVWVLSDKQRGNLRTSDYAAIVGTDLTAVRLTNAMLVYSDNDTPSCGTYIEVGWACAREKTIAFYSPSGNFPGFVIGLRENAADIGQGKIEMFTDLGRACGWLDSVFTGKRI